MNKEMLGKLMESIVTGRPTLSIQLGPPIETESNNAPYVTKPIFVTSFMPKEIKPFIPLAFFPPKLPDIWGGVDHPSLTTRCLRQNAIAEAIFDQSDPRNWMVEVIQTQVIRGFKQTRFNEAWAVSLPPFSFEPWCDSNGSIIAFNLVKNPILDPTT